MTRLWLHDISYEQNAFHLVPLVSSTKLLFLTGPELVTR